MSKKTGTFACTTCPMSTTYSLYSQYYKLVLHVCYVEEGTVESYCNYEKCHGTSSTCKYATLLFTN